MQPTNTFPKVISSDLIEIEFLRLIKNNNGLIRYMMQRLDVPKTFWDDYYQEILINLWNGYRDNWGKIGSISGFVGEVCFRSISAFRRVFTKGANRIITYTDQPYVFDVSDEVYDEPHINSLKMAIENLPEEERDIVKMILAGETYAAMAASSGQPLNYYRRKTASIYASIRESAHRYFERVPNHIPKHRIGKKRTTINTTAKQVDQYDSKGGFIKRWLSTLEASRATGIGQGNISRSATGKIGLAGGYKWGYAPADECREIGKSEPLQMAI